jgi:hypothetical protein
MTRMCKGVKKQLRSSLSYHHKWRPVFSYFFLLLLFCLHTLDMIREVSRWYNWRTKKHKNNNMIIWNEIFWVAIIFHNGFFLNFYWSGLKVSCKGESHLPPNYINREAYVMKEKTTSVHYTQQDIELAYMWRKLIDLKL